jgi:hypothetical protein
MRGAILTAKWLPKQSVYAKLTFDASFPRKVAPPREEHSTPDRNKRSYTEVFQKLNEIGCDFAFGAMGSILPDPVVSSFVKKSHY